MRRKRVILICNKMVYIWLNIERIHSRLKNRIVTFRWNRKCIAYLYKMMLRIAHTVKRLKFGFGSKRYGKKMSANSG